MDFNTLDEIKAKITMEMDVYEVLDILDISLAELLDILEEQIQENREEFVRILR